MILFSVQRRSGLFWVVEGVSGASDTLCFNTFVYQFQGFNYSINIRSMRISKIYVYFQGSYPKVPWKNSARVDIKFA